MSKEIRNQINKIKNWRNIINEQNNTNIMNEKTESDIEKAEKENEDVICIQLYAEAKSPHGDNYVHGSNPCIIDSLVKMGWTK